MIDELLWKILQGDGPNRNTFPWDYFNRFVRKTIGYALLGNRQQTMHCASALVSLVERERRSVAKCDGSVCEPPTPENQPNAICTDLLAHARTLTNEGERDDAIGYILGAAMQFSGENANDFHHLMRSCGIRFNSGMLTTVEISR